MKHTCDDLPIERQRFLAHRLWITNIECCRLFKLEEIVAVFVYNIHDFLTTQRNLASNSVLRRDHILAKTVEHWLIGAPLGNGICKERGSWPRQIPVHHHSCAL